MKEYVSGGGKRDRGKQRAAAAPGEIARSAICRRQ